MNTENVTAVVVWFLVAAVAMWVSRASVDIYCGGGGLTMGHYTMAITGFAISETVYRLLQLTEG